MFESQISIGCNINDRSIELVCVDQSSSPVIITAKGRTELSPTTFHQGRVTDEAAFRRALKSVRAQSGFQERKTIHITLSISEQLVFPFSVAKPPQSSRQQLATLLSEEARKTIPFDPAFQQLFIIKETLEAPIVFAYVLDKRILKEYTRILKDERILIDHIEPDGIALVRYILPDVTLHQHLTLIDVGTNVTHVITIKNGYPVLSQHVPFGAETLSESVRRYGMTPRKIPQTLEVFAQDISTRINRADEFLGQQSDIVAHHSIRILGGGSLLPHLSEIIEQAAQANVTPGSAAHVFATSGLSKKELPIFAHAIGSALRVGSRTTGRELISFEQFAATSTSRIQLSLDSIKKRIAAGFTIFIIIIVALTVLFLVKKTGTSTSPTANINIEDASLMVALKTFTINLADPTIASSFSYIEKIHEEQTTVRTTGIHTKMDYAKGTVRLFNTASTERPLVSGTRLATSDGVIFRTLENLTIPAEGSIDAIVQADAEGATANISNAVRLSVPGLSAFNQQYTYGVTQENFTGGIVTLHVVATKDVEDARETLTSLIKSGLKKQFTEMQSESQKIIQLDAQDVITTTSEPPTDTESQTVTVKVSISEAALLLQSNVLLRFAETELENQGVVQQLDILNAQYDPSTKTGTATVSIRYTR